MTPQMLTDKKEILPAGQAGLPDAHHLSYKPLPGSSKIYRSGKIHQDIRVPFRQIELSATHDHKGKITPNDPICLYDTSGPYTDPAVKVDITQGLSQLRQSWILDRGDVATLPESTSQYRRKRENDLEVASVRFPSIRKPLRAKQGRNVSQMHYARRGINTPEME